MWEIRLQARNLCKNLGFKYLFWLRNGNCWTPDHVWGLNITLQQLVAVNVKDWRFPSSWHHWPFAGFLLVQRRY